MVTGEEDFVRANLLARSQLELARRGRADCFAVAIRFSECR